MPRDIIDLHHRRAAAPEAEAAIKDRDAARAGENPYSVLLLYPDYLNDSGTETFFAHVHAKDEGAAVLKAQEEAAKVIAYGPDDSFIIDDLDAFAPLLVIGGHHQSLPLFNK